MASKSTRDPLLIFAPYLPLRQSVTAGGWWIGPLRVFPGPWRDDRFERLSRMLIADYTTYAGEPVPNPTLIAACEHGADGVWPDQKELRALQLALDFTVIDGNPPWSEESSVYGGWHTATTENSQLHFWPVDLDQGRIARSAGVMVCVTTAGYTIERGFTAQAPIELHLPNDLMLDDELLAALLSVFKGEHDADDGSLARRLAVATTWLGQAWRNTESIRVEERIIMLKTGFEALTDTSNSWRSAEGLEALFRTFPVTSANDFLTQDLVWKPSETESMSYTVKSRVNSCTPLQHWFMSLTVCRNEIIHEGRMSSSSYEVDGSPYTGPYLFVAERILREACRVAMRTFGYDTLWKDRRMRLASRALQPVFDQLREFGAEMQDS